MGRPESSPIEPLPEPGRPLDGPIPCQRGGEAIFVGLDHVLGPEDAVSGGDDQHRERRVPVRVIAKQLLEDLIQAAVVDVPCPARVETKIFPE